MNNPQKETFDISNRTLFKIFASILIFVAGLYFVYKVRSVLTLLVISAFLALSIYRPVNFIANKLKVSRATGTIIAYAIVVGILGYLIYATLPSLVKQLYSFTVNAPEIIENAKNSSKFAASIINGLSLDQKADQFSLYVSDNWSDIASSVAGQFQSLFGFFSSFITVLIVTLLMIAEGPEMLKNFWSLYKDPAKRDQHREIVAKMYRVITGYTNGQVILTTLNASFALVFIMIASKIFGVSLQYPLALWALIWLAGLIPLVGATLGAVIAVGFTIFYSWKLSLAIIIYYIIYQQIENSTLQPWIQSKSINATALTIIVSALVGGSFGGVFGAFAAIPVAGCIKVLFDSYASTQKKSAAKLKSSDDKSAAKKRLQAKA